MRSLPLALYAVVTALLTSPLATASSTTRNPISSISTVQNATIHTYNQRVTALSEFELSFILEQELHVRFHLEPNHDILNQETLVTYLAPDGSIERREHVDRLGHKVFKGTTWISRVGKEEDGHWRNVGWARVSVLQDGKDPVFEGAFSVDLDSHHLQTARHYQRVRHLDDPEITQDILQQASLDQRMVVWRDSDILSDHELRYSTGLKRSATSQHVCSADDLHFNVDPEHPVYVGMRKRTTGSMSFNHLFGKRQTDVTTTGNGAGVNLVSTIGQTQGCPTTRKVALVGVAIDCNYRAKYDSEQAARENVISQINQASGIWEGAFNISLGLAQLTVMNSTCPGSPQQSVLWNQACSASGVDISSRLNYFSAWRGTQSDNYSHWTLLSTCATETAVGLAWLGQACVQDAINSGNSSTGNGGAGGSETVSGANVIIQTSGAAEWQIIAHETGHTYGAVHDCTQDSCSNSDIVNSQQCCQLSSTTCNANGQYIMNPSTSNGINTFSPCSIGNICSAIGRNSVKTSCLSNNKQVTTITGQQCGNGIVEQGEDCDCGGTAGCGNNKCCNPTTCKFTTGSVCDDSNEDCCHSCQLATNGTICRQSTGECDPAETCSGTSPNCPADTSAPDGSSCSSGLQCASGHCTSRDQQCKTVMGSYSQSNDTYACDSSSCVITCASPDFGANCYGLQQNFLDGTTCDGGGTCQNGRCTNVDTGKAITSWINDHKAIVIGVCVGVGVLLLIILFGCIHSCFCGRRARARKAPVAAGPAGWQGWNGPRGQPPMATNYQHPQHASQGWFRGSNNNAPPPPPPAFNPSRSVRYA